MNEIFEKFMINLPNNLANLFFALSVATVILVYVRIRLILECRNIIKETVKSTVQNRNFMTVSARTYYEDLGYPLLIDNAKLLESLLVKAKVLPFTRNDYSNIFHLRHHLDKYTTLQRGLNQENGREQMKLLQAQTNLIFFYATVLSMYNPCRIKHLNEIGRVSPKVLNAWIDSKLKDLRNKL